MTNMQIARFFSQRTAVHTMALLLCAGGSSAFGAIAVGPKDNIYIGGFISQGYLYSENNNFPTANKGGTADFREAALNVSTTVGDHLRVGAQGFLQSFGQLGDDQVILDWAVADYNLRPEFGVRVGRVKYPKGLYGEALDLDAVRPFVFLPLGVYNPVLRDFTASFDGGMVYGNIAIGQGSLDYKVFYGDIPMKPRQGVAEFFNDSGFYPKDPGIRKMGMDSVLGTQLAWNTPLSGLKLVYSYSEFKNLTGSGPFSAYPVVAMVIDVEKLAWNTLSAEYMTGDWVFAAEWQRVDSGTFHYEAAPVTPRIDDKFGWDAWYVSAARRLNDQIELGSYFGYSGDIYGSRERKDYAASVRYDYNEHLIFKAEVHYFDGNHQLFNTARTPNPAATAKQTDTLFAVKSTYMF